MKKCFSCQTVRTHMPYIVEHGGRQILLFSFSETEVPLDATIKYRPWSLGWSDWLDDDDGIHRINTGFPHTAVECNPTAYSDQDRLFLSFVGRLRPGDFYYLLEMDGSSISELSEPRLIVPEPVWSGFKTPNLLCLVPYERDHIVVNGHRFRFAELPIILRAVPAGNDILISGLRDEQPKTLLLSPDGKLKGEVLSDSHSVYKSCFSPDEELVFAVQSEDGFETRDLHWGEFTISSEQ